MRENLKTRPRNGGRANINHDIDGLGQVAIS